MAPFNGLYNRARGRAGATPGGGAEMRDTALNAAEFQISQLTPLQREGMDWIWHMTSGKATQDDLAAMELWKGQSPAHAEALAKAAKLWRLVSAQTAFGYVKPHFLQRPAVTRRLALGGMVAAVVGYGAIRPPLSMWPSIAELSSDYRTGTGVQRRVALRDGVFVQLNTRTSVSLASRQGLPGLELVSGQIALTTDLPTTQQFTVFVGKSRLVVSKADLDVRLDDLSTRVACLDGAVSIEAFGGRTQLGPHQSVVLSPGRISQPIPVDMELETAWRQGRLLFHDAPFQTIVAEVNRYRPGRIVIVNTALARRQFNAAFDIKNIEKVVADLQRLSHATVTQLPGGVVLLA